MKYRYSILPALLSAVLLLGCVEKELATLVGVSVEDANVSVGEYYHIDGKGFQVGDIIAFESKDAQYRFQSVVEEGNVTASGVDILLPKAIIYETEYSLYLVRELQSIFLGSAVFHKGALSLEEGMDYCGIVTDSDGNPIPGVVVSDGYNCTVTDEKGVYQLKGCQYSVHINISIPAEYKVPVQNGMPCFWKTIEADKSRYDFSLERLDAPETDFYLFCIGDPQCQNQNRHVKRFSTETIPDILKKRNELGSAPCYGITLGDVGYNSDGTNNNIKNKVFTAMTTAMDSKTTGMPIFQCIGNHDHFIVNHTVYSVADDITSQKDFQNAFGPVNYSFNRGEAHIVVMDDILFTHLGSYELGFRDDQLEWLRQDLANVPRSKMLILCVHIPLQGNTKNNMQAVKDLIEEFSECHIMSGHTHFTVNYVYPKHYEHTHSAACGAWWYSTVNLDGTPNGYGVFKVKGASIENWIYKGVGLSEEEQIRMYRGNVVFMDGYSPQYTFPETGADDIWANIWNWDSSWKVEVYEDGVLGGPMTRLTSGIRRDPWAVGFHCGVVGRSQSNYDRTYFSHIFHYKLKNPSATDIEIRATDPFGRTFVQKKFTGNTRADWPVAPIDKDKY